MCDHCGWDEYLIKMEDLLEGGLSDSTQEFVEGVYDWVFNNSHITEKQRESIKDIKK